MTRSRTSTSGAPAGPRLAARRAPSARRRGARPVRAARRRTARGHGSARSRAAGCPPASASTAVPAASPSIGRGAGRQDLLGRRRRSAAPSPAGRGIGPAVDVVVEPAADLVAGLERSRPGWTSIGHRVVLGDARRAARREPAAGRAGRSGSGRCRGSTLSSSRTSPTTGIEPMRPRVYGWRGSRKSVVTSACSTISPAYITATRSHISATTPRSWVIRMIAVPVCVAEVPHQVEDLGLDRDVERGRRLVGDQQLRLAGEGHRDHHALGHAARHLVRERLEPPLRVGDADHLEQLEGPLRGPALCFIPRWSSRTSPIWRPTSMTGFSDDCGCWKIMLRSGRRGACASRRA